MAKQASILHTGPKGVAIGNLDWQSISSRQKIGAWSRNYRKRVAEFTHFAEVAGNGDTGQNAIGLYSSVMDELAKPPKGAYSAAQAFASLVGTDYPNAALALKCKDDEVYVVVLEDGLPTNDLVCDSARAVALIGEGRRIYTDIAKLGDADATFDWLSEGRERNAKIRPIPVNVVALSAAVLATAALVGAYGFYTHHRRIVKEREEMEAAEAADPAPHYLQALAIARGRVAVGRADILGAIQRLMEHATIAQGWVLDNIDCDLPQARCTATWLRRGGTYAELKQAMPGSDLVPSVAAAGGATDVDKAQTSFKLHVTPGPLTTDLRKALPDATALMMDLGGTLQVWKTADLKVAQGPATLWPANVAGIPVGFRNASAVTRSEVTIKEIPGPFVAQVVRDAPWYIAWDELLVALTDSPDIKGRLKFSLKGSVYAQQ
jgi:hypothetical protein